MPKITHDDVKTWLEKIVDHIDENGGMTLEEQNNVHMLRNYIAQQEKASQLLELYRTYHFYVEDGNLELTTKLNEDILKLEEELNE